MRRFVVALLAFAFAGGYALAANTEPQPMMTTAQARALADLPEVRTVAVDANGVPLTEIPCMKNIKKLDQVPMLGQFNT